MRKLFVLSSILFCGIFFASCSGSKGKSTIIIRGSTSVEPLMEVILDSYLKTAAGKNVEFDIKCEGSGKGKEAAENDTKGNVIGMSSSAISSTDAPKFSQFNLAKDAVVMIVNKDNSLNDLSSTDIYDIYTGKTTKFAGMDSDITVVARDAASGTREAFESLIKSSEGTKLAGNMTSKAEQLEKTSAVVAKVNTVKSAIGYISLGSLDDSVKALSVDGVAPSVENVQNNTYTLYRPFVILTNATLAKEGKLTEATESFLTYLQSAAVKSLVSSKSYVPVE